MMITRHTKAQKPNIKAEQFWFPAWTCTGWVVREVVPNTVAVERNNSSKWVVLTEMFLLSKWREGFKFGPWHTKFSKRNNEVRSVLLVQLCYQNRIKMFQISPLLKYGSIGNYNHVTMATWWCSSAEALKQTQLCQISIPLGLMSPWFWILS